MCTERYELSLGEIQFLRLKPNGTMKEPGIRVSVKTQFGYNFLDVEYPKLSPAINLLLFILTANGFSSGGSATTIRHNTQSTHNTQTTYITQNNATIKRNTVQKLHTQ
jgi:hypothetical protein